MGASGGADFQFVDKGLQQPHQNGGGATHIALPDTQTIDPWEYSTQKEVCDCAYNMTPIPALTKESTSAGALVPEAPDAQLEQINLPLLAGAQLVLEPYSFW